MFRTILPLTLLSCTLIAQAAAKSLTLYVATNGDDGWSGRLPAPAKDGRDGPLATLPKALKSAREARANLKEAPDAVTIFIHGGTYEITEPLEITSADSGQSAEKALTIAAYRNEQPILSAGQRITGWKGSADNPNKWQAEIPQIQERPVRGMAAARARRSFGHHRSPLRGAGEI